MIKRVLISAVLVSAIFIFTAADWSHSSKYYSEVKEESIHKDLSFSNPAAAKSLIVDNVNGAIHVSGYEGTTVQIEILKTIRARSKNDMELAGREVVLKISEKNNRIELYVDGPFRDSGNTIQSRRYSVHFHFQIKVPNACDLELKTINNGDIRVENVHGQFEIDNINGNIRMNQVAGFGQAHAINGRIKILFIRNPTGDCSFDSLNGNIDVAFPTDLSADCWFKTFNGSAYTNFEIHSLPSSVSGQERRNGMFVYKSNGTYGGRIGKGGPQLKFNTLNGNIQITAR